MITLDLMISRRKIVAATRRAPASTTQYCLVFSVARQDVMSLCRLTRANVHARFGLRLICSLDIDFVGLAPLRLVDKLFRKG